MLETVTAYIERHHLLPPRGEIIVAVSGGADSLCLLHLLHRLCGPGKHYPELRLHVAHLNHKLRGEAGAREAEAIAQLAAAWGLASTIGEVDVPALAREEKRSLEDAARMARYRFLREVAQGQPIAVAHHADDQVETLLLHCLRGGGLGSMIGMLPRHKDIIRPLLAVTHAETVAYCRHHQLVPIEDASNTDPRFLRNRVRHELLPLLESLNSGIRQTLLRNAEVMRVDMEWIEAQVDAAWKSIVITEQEHAIKLRLDALLVLPLSIQRHLLRRVTAQLCEGQSPLELRHYLLIEQLLHQENGGTEHMLDLPNQLQMIRNGQRVIFERPGPRAGARPAPTMIRGQLFSATEEGVILPIPGHVEIPGTPWTASVEIVPDELTQEVRQAISSGDWSKVWQLLPSTRFAVYADYDSVGSFIRVRTRHAGDRVRPLGMKQDKKVQDVLVDTHIPRTERPFVPLFFSTTHCIWVAGVCLDDRVRLTSKTRRILSLSIFPTTI